MTLRDAAGESWLESVLGLVCIVVIGVILYAVLYALAP
jgi:hypothetical protein